jgi:hypothetical protein
MEYKGELQGFPDEVVNKMLDRQVEQGNKRDVTVFEAGKTDGFYWSETTEGGNFWGEVIHDKNFALFFEKYPKQETIPETNPNPPSKIIGYKSPVDMKGWKIKKGDIFKVYEENLRLYDTEAGTSPCIAAEIVETWQPAYEQEEDIFVGDYKVTFVGNGAHISNAVWLSNDEIKAVAAISPETFKKIIDRLNQLNQ